MPDRKCERRVIRVSPGPNALKTARKREARGRMGDRTLREIAEAFEIVDPKFARLARLVNPLGVIEP